LQLNSPLCINYYRLSAALHLQVS